MSATPEDERMTEETEYAGEMPKDARKWAMICHLVALVGLIGNGVGFVLGPLIVWLLKKEDHPFIDEQGKEALNFQLTMFIALFVCAPLILVFVGVFLMIAVAIMMIVFPIIAALKADKGIPYRYPLTVRMIK